MSWWKRIPVTEGVSHCVENHPSIRDNLNYLLLEEFLQEFPHFRVLVVAPSFAKWCNPKQGGDFEALRAISSIDIWRGERCILQDVERMTLYASVEFVIPDTPNPSWQNIRVYYHKCPARFFAEKPRLHMSLQGFLKKFFKLEPTVELLKSILELVLNKNPLSFDPNDYEFHYIRGDQEGAKACFFQAYQNINPQGYCDVYPSVIGSCMRHEHWEFKGKTLGVELPHPLEAYLTDDVGIAWLTDKDGYTVARTLTNEVHKTIVRVYSSAPKVKGTDDCWRDSRATEFLRLLIKSLPEDYRRDEPLGLSDCRLKLLPIDEHTYVMPYLDGGTTRVDLTTRLVGDDYGEQYAEAEEHCPPVVKARARCCWCEYIYSVEDMLRQGNKLFCEGCVEHHQIAVDEVGTEEEHHV